MCGGQDETAVADTSDDAAEQGWTETVESGFSGDSIDRSNAGTGSNETE
jgi:hypothetical protein